MPVPKKGKDFLGKYTNLARETWDQHRHDPVDYGNDPDSIPPGINNGKLLLTKIGFDVFKSGEYTGEHYFSAEGIIVVPKVHDGTVTQGKRIPLSRFPEPLCETPNSPGQRKTFQDHWLWVMQKLRRLGIADENTDPDQLEDIFAALLASNTYVKFRTWVGKATPQFPNPRVNFDWQGMCEYSESESESEDAPMLVDETSAPDASEKNEWTEEELTALAKRADDGDQNAAAELDTVARDLGATAQQIDDAESWTDVVNMLVAGGDEENEDEAEKEDWLPEKGQKCRYGGAEVVITAVQPSKQTCNVRAVDGSASHKGVPWSDLDPSV